jgi:hypothetical protein
MESQGKPQSAAPAEYKPGQRLKLKDGRTVTFKGYNPDGSLEVE